MPIGSALVVTAIVSALVVFGAVLAWVSHRTGSGRYEGTPAE
jgi:hypothetical protein